MKIIGYCSFVNHISLMFLQKNHNILITNTLWLKINGGQGGITFIDYKYTYEYNVQFFVQFPSSTAEPNR